MINKLKYILKKEFLVIGRDIHSVAVLFILPVVFILIMSLSMKDLYQSHSKIKINAIILNRDKGKISQEFINTLKNDKSFSFYQLKEDTTDTEIAKRVLNEDYKFACIVDHDFSLFFEEKSAVNQNQKPVTLLINPTVNAVTREIVGHIIKAHLRIMKVEKYLNDKSQMLGYAGIKKDELLPSFDLKINEKYLYKDKQIFIVPSSVQQNVPAWLIFSMFFIVIPISNIFITERNYGTELKILSMNVPKIYLLLGKMVPYYFINMLQVFLMLMVGRYIVPLLGGGTLTLGNSYSGLVLVGTGISYCAISYAFVIASIAKTTEQATVIGGFGNIILGAISGIMVPKFIMPEFIQQISAFSPMCWGLSGFLDIFLRNGNILDVLPEFLLLISFGTFMIICSLIILKIKSRKSL